MPRPTPLVAPVTTATRPCRFMSVIVGEDDIKATAGEVDPRDKDGAGGPIPYFEVLLNSRLLVKCDSGGGL
jgi:hypothetical protein